jgi:hypothetical protein
MKTRLLCLFVMIVAASCVFQNKKQVLKNDDSDFDLDLETLMEMSFVTNDTMTLRIWDDHIEYQGYYVYLGELNEKIKDFLVNVAENKEQNFPLVGKQKVSAGEIILKKKCTPEYFQTVMDTIQITFAQIRHEKAVELFQKEYESLTNRQQKVINDIIPIRVSGDIPQKKQIK